MTLRQSEKKGRKMLQGLTLNKTFRRFFVISGVLAFIWFVLEYNEQGKRFKKLKSLQDTVDPSHSATGVLSSASHKKRILPGLSFPSQGVVEQPEVLHIVTAMYSENSAIEGALLLKSALMYQSTPIDFHILVDHQAQSYIEKVIKLIQRPVHRTQVIFYPIHGRAMERRLDRTATGMGTDNPLVGAFRTNHPGGYMGMMKLFMHEIIDIKVKRIMWVDTDILFLSDPLLLWREFSTFKETTAIMIPSHDVFGPNEESWQSASRVCSCIMLMDLERLRKSVFMYSSLFDDNDKSRALAPSAVKQVWGDPRDGAYYNHVEMGDQGYFWALKVYAPELFMHLPLSWELSNCLWGMYGLNLNDDDTTTNAQQLSKQKNLVGTPDQENSLTPNLLHFNCLPGDDGAPDIYFKKKLWSDPEHPLNQEWGSAVKYHAQYKFIWLNKGKESMTIVTRTDLRFWDEIVAGRKYADGYD